MVAVERVGRYLEKIDAAIDKKIMKRKKEAEIEVTTALARPQLISGLLHWTQNYKKLPATIPVAGDHTSEREQQETFERVDETPDRDVEGPETVEDERADKEDERRQMVDDNEDEWYRTRSEVMVPVVPSPLILARRAGDETGVLSDENEVNDSDTAHILADLKGSRESNDDSIDEEALKAAIVIKVKGALDELKKHPNRPKMIQHKVDISIHIHQYPAPPSPESTPELAVLDVKADALELSGLRPWWSRCFACGE